MLDLQKQRSKLQNINVRAEKHGQENKLAVDLKISINVSNDVLAEFDPDLKSSFYKKGDEKQGELIDDVNHLPALKFPKLKTISWDVDLNNFDLSLHLGIDKKSDVIMQDVTVDKFKFTPKDGGTVQVDFRVITHPEPAQLARLASFIQDEIDISLVWQDPPAGDFVQTD